MFHVKQMTKNLIKTRIEKYLKKPVYKVIQNVSRETFFEFYERQYILNHLLADLYVLCYTNAG